MKRILQKIQQLFTSSKIKQEVEVPQTVAFEEPLGEQANFMPEAAEEDFQEFIPPQAPSPQIEKVSEAEVKSIKEGLLASIEQWDFQAVSMALEGVDTFQIQTAKEFSKPILELSKGLEIEEVEIKEVDKSGSVQDLRVVNKSKKYLLIYEGSLLEGQKQNRIVNATILLEPQSETVIPVSCVERGRWDSDYDEDMGFGKPMYDVHSKMRQSVKKEILKRKAGYKGSQNEVWEEVDKFASDEQTDNNTQDFSDHYQKSNKKRFIFKEGLKLNSQGILVHVNDQDYLDFVNNQEAFAQVLERVSKGYELGDKEKNMALKDKPQDFIRQLIEKEHKDILVQKSVGLGRDIRLETEAHLISVLQVEDEFLALNVCKK